MLKEKIIEDGKISDILEALECHSIREQKDYFSAALPDGDNSTSINVYKDSLVTLVHTRSQFDSSRPDIISLVEFIKGIYITKAIYWICEVCGYEYYTNKDKQDFKIDPCIQFLRDVQPHKNYDDEELSILDEKILNQYIQYPHISFYEDGISLDIQKKFEIGYYVRDECITIPIRDELGNLVGVKGRTVRDYKRLGISKYWFPYPTAKTQILYGLYRSYDHIIQSGEVFVYESEKGVMQSYSMGIKNCVSIGGHEIDPIQVLKLEKLGVKIVLAFDKGLSVKDIRKEYDRFIIKDKVYTLYDKNNILTDPKSSPTDEGREKFIKLYTENKYKIN